MILFSINTADSDSGRSTTLTNMSSSLKPPMKGRRRRKSGSTNTTLHSNDSFFTPARTVRFSEEEPQAREADCIIEDPAEVWFPMDYLQQTRREEIKNNLRAQYFSNRQEGVSIESDALTWRGLEDILEKYDRSDKQAKHTLAVVHKSKSQRDAFTPKAQQSLRQFSKGISKADRHRATELAAKDAALVDRPVRSSSPLANIGRTIRALSPGPGRISRPTTADRTMKFQRRKSHSMDINLFRWKMGGGDKVMGCNSQEDHPSDVQ